MGRGKSKNVKIAEKKDEIAEIKKRIRADDAKLQEKRVELRDIKKEGKLYGDPQAEVQW